MKNFKILTSKYTVLYIITINLLPLLFYKILNWNVAEYFLYFLTESVIIGLFLFIKGVFYMKIKELFVNTFGLILYIFACFILTSFFSEVGYVKDTFNQLLYNFYVVNWQFSLLPIIILQISNSLYSYRYDYEVESKRQYGGILVGRFIVYTVIVFPIIMLLNFTKSYIFLLIFPIIVRTLYELDGKIKLKEKLSSISIAKFVINFLLFIFILMFVLAFINKNISPVDIIAGTVMFAFILIFRKSIYSMGGKNKI